VSDPDRSDESGATPGRGTGARSDAGAVAPGARPAKFLGGSLMRHVVTMSLSASVGLVSVFIVDFADLYFISLLGEAELAAAVGFAGTLLFLVFSAAIGLAIAMAALVAPRVGRGELDEARTVAGGVMIAGVALFVVLTAIAFLWRAEAIALLGATGRTHALAVDFLAIVLPAMPFGAIGMMGSAVLRAHGDARRAMQVTLWAGGVNAVLDPLFIFALGLGLDGAAWATVAARAAMAAAAVLAVRRHYGGFTWPGPARLAADLRPMFAIAGPAVLTNIATPIGNGIATRAIAPFGDGAVAAWAVIGRLTPLAFCVLFAVSGAVGPIIGQNAGAERYERVRETLLRAMQFVALAVLVSWALLLAARSLIVEQFGLGPEGARLLWWFAVAVAPLSLFNGALFVSNAAFNNLHRPLWATWLNWGRHTLGVAPFVWVGAVVGGAPGVLVGQALGGFVFGLLGLWLAARLIDGYAGGRLDREGHRSPPLMRARPDAPFTSPRG